MLAGTHNSRSDHSEHGTKLKALRIQFLTRSAPTSPPSGVGNAPTFAAAAVRDAQAGLAALGSLVVAHGLVRSAVRRAQRLGLRPRAVQVALRVSVTVAY